MSVSAISWAPHAGVLGEEWRPRTLQRGEDGPSLIDILDVQVEALHQARQGGRQAVSCQWEAAFLSHQCSFCGAGLLYLRELGAAGSWLPIDRSPGGSQDPGWSAIFPFSELLMPGVWGLAASGAGGRKEDSLPSLKQTQKGRNGASGFEVQRTTSSGGGHAEPQTRRGWARAARPRATPTACTGREGRAGLPASTASWALRVTGVQLLPHP